MGYNTRYKLSVEYAAPVGPTAAIEMLRLGSKEAEHCLTAEGNPAEEGKWYEHESELKALSARFPHLLFSLRGEGEEPGNIWAKYFLSGRVQVEKASLAIAPFDPTKLKG